MYEILNISAAWEEAETRRRAAEAEKRRLETEELTAEESDEPQTVKGWTASPRQILLMRIGDRAAVDKFFNDNYLLLQRAAYCYYYKKSDKRQRELLDINDLINQVYIDMRSGYLLVELEYMWKYIFHSFYYALVGGFGNEKGAYTYRPRKKSAGVV